MDLSLDPFLLPIAFGLGALHAFEPGHGKTLVSVYWAGNEGNIRDAIILGGVVAISHTLSVLAIAFSAVWVLSNVFHQMETTLDRSLDILAGGLIFIVGSVMLWRSGALHQLSAKLLPAETLTPALASTATLNSTSLNSVQSTESHHHHPIGCSHTHHHPPTFNTDITKTPVKHLRELFLLGLASGLCPSPIPLMLVITTLTAGNGQDLPLVLLTLTMFSIGLASVVVVLGVGFISLRQIALPFFNNDKNDQQFSKWLSIASSLLLIGLGGYLILNGFDQTPGAHAHHGHETSLSQILTGLLPH